jgi:hypothetical protein
MGWWDPGPSHPLLGWAKRGLATLMESTWEGQMVEGEMISFSSVVSLESHRLGTPGEEAEAPELSVWFTLL